MSEKQSANEMVFLFGVFGMILGLPLSYCFQTSLVRMIPFWEYIKALPEILRSKAPHANANLLIEWITGNILDTVVLTCVICAVLLGIIGYSITWMSKK